VKSKQIRSDNPPIYFVPNRILCSCGQMVHTATTTNMIMTAMCTNPLCSENLVEKRIDLSKFAFTEYEVLKS
jgi:hypothetical protein